MSGIEASGYALTPPEILSKNESTGSKYIQTIRNKVYHRLIQILGGDNGNFAAAILIGETKAIPKTISENMRNSGVAHVLSVSGLHLSLVAMLFFVSCRVILNCSNYFAYNTNIKIIAASASIIGSFMYLQISGSNIAATRAFIMSSVFIISLMLGRSPEPLRSIMIAAFLILLFFPEYIFHPSFQLSFAAVLCLISGYELYIKYENVINSAKGIFFSIKFYVYGNIYSSLLASIATAPFVIFHFYKFATYSVLMNLIAVPLMSFFMMPLGLISMLLMPFGADEFPLKALGFFISIVTSSAAYITALPASVWAWGHISPMSLAVFSLCFFWVCLWKTKWRLAGLAVMFLSLFMMNNTKKPDFIYDHTLKAIGLNSQRLGSPKLGSPRLEFQIYVHDKMPKFTSNYWVSWYGAKEASITRKKIAAKDLIFKLPSGKTVSLNYWRCTYADIQIITSKKLKCDNGGQVISNKELWKHKQILLYCDEKECRVQYREQNRWW
ncbi:MAG: competence protein ComEC [Rickettsiales bacterium]|nr:MAG: competence protein ComEC [Rickettsiales bacterium]